jgi:hypothetical protein
MGNNLECWSIGVEGFGLLFAFRPGPFLFTARFAQDAKVAKGDLFSPNRVSVIGKKPISMTAYDSAKPPCPAGNLFTLSLFFF